jgi:hypothetical protein
LSELLSRFGIGPASRVSLLGVRDAEFLRAVLPQLANPAQHRAAMDSDHIFLAAESAQQLKRVAPLVKYLRPGGRLWVLAGKGVGAGQVAAALAGAGLRVGPAVAFNTTYTALPGELRRE